jgi:hypothetical protein
MSPRIIGPLPGCFGRRKYLAELLADADYESGRNKRNTLTVSPENIGRSGLGKKFWNIKVKKCRVKAAANKYECRSANPTARPASRAWVIRC